MRAAKRPTRFTAPLFFLPTLFVAQVIFCETLHFLRVSWYADSTPPLAVSRTWEPNRVYTKEIEQGIDALSRSDPDKVSFLRERGIPINVVTPSQMAVSGCPARSFGCTRHTDSSINIVAAAAASPMSLAVVLSHELTHCRLHDQRLGMNVSSGWTRLLWRNEEATAHVAGLRTAGVLGLSLSGGPLTGWWLEYLFWYWPAATLLTSGLASLFGFHVTVEYIKRHATQKASPPSDNSTVHPIYRQPAPTPAIL